MPRHFIDCDEKYPFFSLSSLEDKWYIELTDEEHADYQRVMNEFHAWQKRLDEAWDASSRKRR